MGVNEKDFDVPVDNVSGLSALLGALLTLGNKITLPLLKALLLISVRPGLSVNELAEALLIPQQSASRYVSALLGRYASPIVDGDMTPLVKQLINPQEPRKRSLYLTSAGADRLCKFGYMLKKTEDL